MTFDLTSKKRGKENEKDGAQLKSGRRRVPAEPEGRWKSPWKGRMPEDTDGGEGSSFGRPDSFQ